MIQYNTLIVLSLVFIAMVYSLALVEIFAERIAVLTLYYKISKDGYCRQGLGGYVSWSRGPVELEKVLKVCPELRVEEDGLNYTVYFIVAR